MKYLFLFALSLSSCSNEEALEQEVERLRLESRSKDNALEAVTNDLIATQDSLFSVQLRLEYYENGPGLILEP